MHNSISTAKARCKSTDEEIDRFTWDWGGASDRFLACGFISPVKFVEVVRRLGVRSEYLPTDVHRRVFTFLVEVGKERITCAPAIIVDAILECWPDLQREEVEVIAYAVGAAASVDTFARWVLEHGQRVQVYRRCRSVLTDARPIGEVAEELLRGIF